MNESLLKWVSAADASMHLSEMKIVQGTLDNSYVLDRFDDYYISLVGALFNKLRAEDAPGEEWAYLANAIAQASRLSQQTARWSGVMDHAEAMLFAATSFYVGGYPAAAYLVARKVLQNELQPSDLANLDLLLRRIPISPFTRELLNQVRNNNLPAMHASLEAANEEARASLQHGPKEFISAKLLQTLTARFVRTNIRSVLNDQPGDWDPLINSFLNRATPTWEFFPSQIQAIERGILRTNQSFSLQMPTGSGKTTLCETILFGHLNSNPNDAALLLVPFRSLASELRGSLVANLNRMGIASRSAYGGTVPTGDEVHSLADVRAVVATPESVSGLLGADSAFSRRISLVVCDEGHLLDGGQRGIALELLIARLRARIGGSPKIIFISAIVPNIQEINAWLGGTEDTVVVSNYRPSIAEFASLIAVGNGINQQATLRMHPHLAIPARFDIERFLNRDDFSYINPDTGRRNRYSIKSIKTRAVAAARKALPMGLVAIFAANKKGHQGAVGVGEELLKQLEVDLNLPLPAEYSAPTLLPQVVQYFQKEFGVNWIGTRLLAAGAAVHHGDLPQESREVLEKLIRSEGIRLVVCTSTLAEGVNLPIRTLVLYSVQRVDPTGQRTSLLARDIKNLVGRAGRAGSTTKGLVICVNEGQWPVIEQVAIQGQMEPVNGALRKFLEALRERLHLSNLPLTQELLEAPDADRETLALVDGVDAVLVELAAEELGQQTLAEVAAAVAEASFAATGVDLGAKQLLKDVFSLRAQRVEALRESGRLTWIRTRGAKARYISSVETTLLPARDDWGSLAADSYSDLFGTLLDWAWTHYEVRIATCAAFSLPSDEAGEQSARANLSVLAVSWAAGSEYQVLAGFLGMEVDDVLTATTHTLGFALISVLEQGVAILDNLVEGGVSQEVDTLIERLRFGVPSKVAVDMMVKGVRHRSAAVALSRAEAVVAAAADLFGSPLIVAAQILREDANSWRENLGTLVYENTLADLPLED